MWVNPGEICDNGADDDGNGYIDDCRGWDFANDDPTIEDANGHGTHVAGIIAAEANNRIGISGVAYDATIMPLKIGDSAPRLSAAILAMRYAIDNGAWIINASWVADHPAAEDHLEGVLDEAQAAGVLVITGAGNDGADLDSSPLYPASSPHDNIIVVGASTPSDTPASYSGYGASTVDLFAPGEHIASTLPGGGYGIFSGTSMAAPMVSGAAAMLWSATPNADYSEVRGALLDRSAGPNNGVTAFRGLAASDGRLDIKASITTRLFAPSLEYYFRDFDAFDDLVEHDVAVRVRAIDPHTVPPQTKVHHRAGLYVPKDGNAMAVVGQEIVYATEAGDTAVVTDGAGLAFVSDPFSRSRRPWLVHEDGDVTEMRMSLPAGTYALVMEVVDINDPATPVVLGEHSAVFFIVGAGGDLTMIPPPDLPPGPGPIPTPTIDPSPTTSTTSTLGGVEPIAATTTTLATGSTTTTTAAPVTPTTSAGVTTTAAPTTTTTTTAGLTTTTVVGTATTSTTSTTTTTVAVEAAMRLTAVNPDRGPSQGGRW